MSQDEIIAVLDSSQTEVTESNNFYEKLFSAVKDSYERSQFCDVTIYGEDNGGTLRGIQCHSIVLCSIAPSLKEILLEQNEEMKIFLPEVSFEVVENFINSIYEGLCSSSGFELAIDQDLAALFGMLEQENSEKKMVEIVVENNQGILTNQQFEIFLPDPTENEGTFILDETLEQTPKVQNEIVKKRSTRKRAAAGEAWGPLAKILVTDDQISPDSNYCTILRYDDSCKVFQDLKDNISKCKGKF